MTTTPPILRTVLLFEYSLLLCVPMVALIEIVGRAVNVLLDIGIAVRGMAEKHPKYSHLLYMTTTPPILRIVPFFDTSRLL